MIKGIKRVRGSRRVNSKIQRKIHKQILRTNPGSLKVY